MKLNEIVGRVASLLKRRVRHSSPRILSSAWLGPPRLPALRLAHEYYKEGRGKAEFDHSIQQHNPAQ
jgi:hypothetical protein